MLHFTFLIVFFLSLISGQWIRHSLPLPTDNTNVPVSFGCSLSFSNDGQTLAIAASASASSTWMIYIYKAASSIWNTNPFQALTNSDAVGSICWTTLSGDGKTLTQTGSGYNANHGGVWIWIANPTTGVWEVQTQLNGGGGDTFFGSTTALSNNGNVVAITQWIPQVHTYKRDPTSLAWTPFSSFIPGTFGDSSAISLALSTDGMILIVGNSLESSNVGASWVYTQTTTGWTQAQTLLGNSGTDNTVGTWQQGFKVGISTSTLNQFIVAGSDSVTGKSIWIFNSQYHQIARLNGVAFFSINNAGNFLVAAAQTTNAFYVYGYTGLSNLSATIIDPPGPHGTVSVSNTNLIATSQATNLVGIWTFQDCTAGNYFNGSINTCSACSAGYYSSSGQTICTACAAGKFSTASGAASCQGCLAGKYSTVVGATSSATCQGCVAGKYSNVVGAATCQDCPAETFSSTIGATTATTCQDCALGTTSDPGAVVCHDRVPTFQNFSKMRFSTLKGSQIEIVFHLQNATITNFFFSNPLAYAFAPALSTTSVRIVDATGTITLYITPPLSVPLYVYANRWPPGTYTFSSYTKIRSLTGGATLSPNNLTLTVPLGNNLAFSGVLEFRPNLSFVQWTGTAINSPTSILFVAAVAD